MTWSIINAAKIYLYGLTQKCYLINEYTLKTLIQAKRVSECGARDYDRPVLLTIWI
jgi:hypothetical protein